MSNEEKSRELLLKELARLRKQVAALETSAVGHRKAAEELFLYQRAMESCNEQVAVVDRKYVYLLANLAFLDFHHLKQEQVIGHTVQEVLGKDVFGKSVKPRLERCLEGEAVHFEMDYPGADLRPQYFHVSYYPLRGARNRITGVLAVINDITEYKQIEQALRENEERFRKIFEEGPLGMALATPDYRFVRVNSIFCRMTGYTKKELTSMTFMDITHPEHIGKDKKAVARLFKGEIPFYKTEKKYIRKDKEQIWGSLTCSVIRDQEGVPLYSLAVIEDITERKLADEALRESEESFRTLYETAPLAINITDRDWKIIKTNQAFEKMVGYTKEELQKMSFADLTCPEDLDQSRNLFQELVENKRKTYRLEKRYRRRDGSLVWGNVVVSGVYDPDCKFLYSFGMIEDITERKQAEEALREYQRAVESSKDMIAAIDRQYNYIFVNETFLSYNKISRNQVVGRKVADLLGKEVFENLVKKQAERCFNGHSVRYEMTQHYPEMEDRNLEVSYFPLKGDNDRIVGLVAHIRDITERKLAEEALRESEERFRDLVENINDLVYAIDAGGLMTYVSPVAESLLGYTPAEIVGRPFTDFIYREDVPLITKKFGERLTGKMEASEYRAQKKSGEIRWIRTSSRPIFRGGKIVGLRGVLSDITERKQIEEERAKYSKLESIGILAGGLAHDFNNILTAILGNITLAQLLAGGEGKFLEPLTAAENASLRARDLTQQLLTFSKGGAPVKKTASLAGLVRDSAMFSVRGSKTRCVFSIPENLWAAEVDEGQISQVINNLVINADQAMPEGGVIRISLENVNLGPQEVPLLQAGRYVKITVQDQGIGVAKEHLQKIFDPYFSTKQKGSGLGLATSYSIIRRHDGHIAVESELPKGSAFKVFLPASDKTVPGNEELEEGLPALRGRILVMDDEEVVRSAAASMLKYIGHQVALARDGAEAIGKYQKALKSGRPFDAVIMDLTVPSGMGGLEAVNKLLEIDPEVKAVVSSGYSNDPVLAEFGKYGFQGIISKPYNVDELKKVIERILSARETS